VVCVSNVGKGVELWTKKMARVQSRLGEGGKGGEKGKVENGEEREGERRKR